MYIFWFLHQTTTMLAYYKSYFGCISFDSYIKPQRAEGLLQQFRVVYLLIPTSNHNTRIFDLKPNMLYIFWFLHQTTTLLARLKKWFRCISFDSYIKPQLSSNSMWWKSVVYLLIPTSNHNSRASFLGRGMVVYLLIPTSNHNL